MPNPLSINGLCNLSRRHAHNLIQYNILFNEATNLYLNIFLACLYNKGNFMLTHPKSRTFPSSFSQKEPKSVL